ncbi:iron ABC transporter permease [Oxalobacter vibrioformis]|uniref:Iron ABC transporter permease n=2 Tax=Oxalobacter vibrioformis TaxID=933080 RepID=A0A9E9LXJ9_9BURK|nr:iron ABC transporter permease [Oxalobacter vibrioformis]WAW10714.1 iron ABC transporter permease [Oxalobacter vibrioformis]
MLNQTGIQTGNIQWKRRPLGMLVVLAGLSILCLLGACLAGSESVNWHILPSAFFEMIQGESVSLTAILLSLRLHRVLAAFLTGGSLALAGVMMQALLRNPLADPYVLGVSGGASVGALLMLFLGGAAWMMDAAAFTGAVAVAVFLYWLARKELGQYAGSDGGTRLLLTGVILAFGCGALVTLLLSIAPDGSLRGMVFWLVGDLEGASMNGLSVVVLLVVLAIILKMARSVNLLALYAEDAAALGVNVAWVRKSLFIGSALLTACAVSNAGSIGFVGLIVPHLCRMALGSDHRLLLPTATLVGGSFLVLADTLARILMAPQQLPVGAVTALIGVPVFLFQLYRFRGN